MANPICSRYRAQWLGVALLASLALTAAAARPAPTALEASLLAAEDQAFQAEIKGDAKAIAAGFADDGTFTHANGLVQTKSMYIEAITSGHLPYKSILPEHRVAWVSGDLGVTHADMHLVVGTMHLAGSYTAVYRMIDGRWQMTDWQSSAAPGSMGPHK